MSPNSGSLKDKKVLIFQQRGWAINIGHFLAKKLQSEGCRLAALTFKGTIHEFILNQKEVNYDFIISNDKVESRPKEYLGNDDYTLTEIEEALGIESIWPIVMSLRNHVKSYGEKYYYSFKQNVSDEEIIYLIKATYKCTKTIFDEFKPDLIISPSFAALPHIMFNLYAKKKGVTMLAVIESRIRGIYIFSHDYLDSTGDFWNRVDELNLGNEKSHNQDRAKKYIEEFRENFIQPLFVRREPPNPLFKKIRHIFSPFYHIIQWYIKPSVNVLESTGITVDYRPPRIILRDHYTHDRYKRQVNAFPYYPFKNVGKYVYFPLQSQPEIPIDVQAPHCSNQIETARQVAMSLPYDYTLVVKDHPFMFGYRSPSYLEKIARTVNVKLIDYRTPNEQVIKGADLIIGPSGTTLTEAAFLNKPAIQLGNCGVSLKLPNVFKHTDMTTLTSKIKEVLKMNLSGDEYERRLENYVTAAYDTGFDADYFQLWEVGGSKEDKEKLWQNYKSEIKKIL
jgi:hypothetical protein